MADRKPSRRQQAAAAQQKGLNLKHPYHRDHGRVKRSEFQLISPESDISNPSSFPFPPENIDNEPTPSNDRVIIMENVPHPDRISKNKAHVLPNISAPTTRKKKTKLRRKFKQGADKVRVQTTNAVRQTSTVVKKGATKVMKKAVPHHKPRQPLSPVPETKAKEVVHQEKQPSVASAPRQEETNKNNITLGLLSNTKDSFFESLWQDSKGRDESGEKTPTVALNKAFEEAVGLHQADTYFDRLAASNQSPSDHDERKQGSPLISQDDSVQSVYIETDEEKTTTFRESGSSDKLVYSPSSQSFSLDNETTEEETVIPEVTEESITVNASVAQESEGLIYSPDPESVPSAYVNGEVQDEANERVEEDVSAVKDPGSSPNYESENFSLEPSNLEESTCDDTFNYASPAKEDTTSIHQMPTEKTKNNTSTVSMAETLSPELKAELARNSERGNVPSMEMPVYIPDSSGNESMISSEDDSPVQLFGEPDSKSVASSEVHSPIQLLGELKSISEETALTERADTKCRLSFDSEQSKSVATKDSEWTSDQVTLSTGQVDKAVDVSPSQDSAFITASFDELVSASGILYDDSGIMLSESLDDSSIKLSDSLCAKSTPIFEEEKSVTEEELHDTVVQTERNFPCVKSTPPPEQGQSVNEEELQGTLQSETDSPSAKSKPSPEQSVIEEELRDTVVQTESDSPCARSTPTFKQGQTVPAEPEPSIIDNQVETSAGALYDDSGLTLTDSPSLKSAARSEQELCEMDKGNDIVEEEVSCNTLYDDSGHKLTDSPSLNAAPSEQDLSEMDTGNDIVEEKESCNTLYYDSGLKLTDSPSLKYTTSPERELCEMGKENDIVQEEESCNTLYDDSRLKLTDSSTLKHATSPEQELHDKDTKGGPVEKEVFCDTEEIVETRKQGFYLGNRSDDDTELYSSGRSLRVTESAPSVLGSDETASYISGRSIRATESAPGVLGSDETESHFSSSSIAATESTPEVLEAGKIASLSGGGSPSAVDVPSSAIEVAENKDDSRGTSLDGSVSESSVLETKEEVNGMSLKPTEPKLSAIEADENASHSSGKLRCATESEARAPKVDEEANRASDKTLHTTNAVSGVLQSSNYRSNIALSKSADDESSGYHQRKRTGKTVETATSTPNPRGNGTLVDAPTANNLSLLSPADSMMSTDGPAVPMLSDQALSNAAFLFSPSYAPGIKSPRVHHARPPRELHSSSFSISTAESRSRLASFSSRSRPAFRIPISSAPDKLVANTKPSSASCGSDDGTDIHYGSRHSNDDNQKHVHFANDDECFVLRESNKTRVAMGTLDRIVVPEIASKVSDLTDTGSHVVITRAAATGLALQEEEELVEEAETTSVSTYISAFDEGSLPSIFDCKADDVTSNNGEHEVPKTEPTTLSWSYRENNGVLSAATPVRANAHTLQANNRLAPTNSPMIRFREARSKFSPAVTSLSKKSTAAAYEKPSGKQTVPSTKVPELNGRLRSNRQNVWRNPRRETGGQNVLAPRQATLEAPLFRNPIIMSYRGSQDESDKQEKNTESHDPEDAVSMQQQPVTQEEAPKNEAACNSDEEDDVFADILKQMPDDDDSSSIQGSSVGVSSLISRWNESQKDQPRILGRGLSRGTSLRSVVSQDTSAISGLTFDSNKENPIIMPYRGSQNESDNQEKESRKQEDVVSLQTTGEEAPKVESCDSDGEDDVFADILKQMPEDDDSSSIQGSSIGVSSLISRWNKSQKDQTRILGRGSSLGASLRSVVSQDTSALTVGTFDSYKDKENSKVFSDKSAQVNPMQQKQHNAPPGLLCLSPMQRTPMQARKWRTLAAAAQEKDRAKKKGNQFKKGLRERNGNVL